jgi:hypothetical protein
MNKKWIIGGLIVGGLATVLVLRRRSGDSWDDDGYDDDEIDDPAGDGEFGHRDAKAPEQEMSPARMRHDVTAEQLSTAARVETAFSAIRQVWPTLTLEEVRGAEGDLDRLAGVIAEKAEQPRGQVRTRLDEILAREVPDASYPAH